MRLGKLRRKQKEQGVLMLDLRLTHFNSVWIWMIYHNGDRIHVGITRGGIRRAFHDATEWAKPNKIVTAGVTSTRRKNDT